jgi:hypothetical protein
MPRKFAEGGCCAAIFALEKLEFSPAKFRQDLGLFASVPSDDTTKKGMVAVRVKAVHIAEWVLTSLITQANAPPVWAHGAKA